MVASSPSMPSRGLSLLETLSMVSRSRATPRMAKYSHSSGTSTPAAPGPSAPGPSAGDGRQASGREPHTQKITVYLSAAELFDLERARLALRAYGITVDRGRLVREAIAVLLADLDSEGETSLLAGRLRDTT